MKYHFYVVLAISSILFCVSCNFADGLVANYHYNIGSSKRKSGNLENAIREYSYACRRCFGARLYATSVHRYRVGIQENHIGTRQTHPSVLGNFVRVCRQSIGIQEGIQKTC